MHTFTSYSRAELKHLRAYQKKTDVYATKINGPFEIVNDSGETTSYCIDGYLIYYNKSNNAGLMSARDFEELYEEVK